MRVAISAAALLAFASSVLAQNPNFNPVRKPGRAEEVAAGSTYEIVWDVPPAFADVTIKINLIGGKTQGGQVPLVDVGSGIANSAGKYSWAVPATLEDLPFYGLQLTSEANAADFQYSDPFRIVGGGAGASNDTTTTVTTGTATVTVSLSTLSTTVTVSTPPAHHNGTTTVPHTTVTRTSTPAGTPTTTLSTSRTPAAGAQATAGVFAVVGGLALAALAL